MSEMTLLELLSQAKLLIEPPSSFRDRAYKNLCEAIPKVEQLLSAGANQAATITKQADWIEAKERCCKEELGIREKERAIRTKQAEEIKQLQDRLSYHGEGQCLHLDNHNNIVRDKNKELAEQAEEIEGLQDEILKCNDICVERTRNLQEEVKGLKKQLREGHHCTSYGMCEESYKQSLAPKEPPIVTQGKKKDIEAARRRKATTSDDMSVEMKGSLNEYNQMEADQQARG